MTSVIFFGDTPESVIAIHYLISLGWNIVAIISNKDDSNFIQSPTLEYTAKKFSIPYLTQQELLNNNPQCDLIISYMYSGLIQSTNLKLAKIAAVNFHPAPLPYFGGWALYSIAILEEATAYGVTCHHMDHNFNTGDICMQSMFVIHSKQETAISLEQKSQTVMLKLLKEFCNQVQNKKPLPKYKQDPKQMRYITRKEFEALKKIPHNANANVIDKYARAFWHPPYHLAYIIKNGKKIEVIPEIAKQQCGKLLYTENYINLVNSSNLEQNSDMLTTIPAKA